MRMRFLVLLLFVAVAMPLLDGCGSDPTGPENGGSSAFSRMIFGSGTDNTLSGDVAVTSDGLRVMVGQCGHSLQITGSSTTLDPSGTSHFFVAGFNADGSTSSVTLVPGAGTPPEIHAMVSDPSNNLVIAGFFFSDITFGSINLTGSGSGDVFVAKLDATGHPMWAQGGTQGVLDDEATDLAVAPDGSIYVAGLAYGEIGLAGVTAGVAGKYSGYLVKLGANGDGIWQKTATATSQSTCWGTAVSQDGSVLVCGDFAGSSVTIGGVVLPNDGLANAFISRFSAGGAGMGNIRIGGPGTAVARRVATIGDEPVVAGTFTGTADFDVDTSAGSMAAVGIDVFIARYSRAGELRWVVTLGGADDQFVSDLALTDSGDIVVCGTFSTILTAGSTTLNSVGATDAYFARVSADGQVRSAQRVGGSNDETTTGIAVSGASIIVVGSSKSNDLSFPDGSQRPLAGEIDAFIYQQP